MNDNRTDPRLASRKKYEKKHWYQSGMLWMILLCVVITIILVVILAIIVSGGAAKAGMSKAVYFNYDKINPYHADLVSINSIELPDLVIGYILISMQVKKGDQTILCTYEIKDMPIVPPSGLVTLQANLMSMDNKEKDMWDIVSSGKEKLYFSLLLEEPQAKSKSKPFKITQQEANDLVNSVKTDPEPEPEPGTGTETETLNKPNIKPDVTQKKILEDPKPRKMDNGNHYIYMDVDESEVNYISEQSDNTTTDPIYLNSDFENNSFQEETTMESMNRPIVVDPRYNTEDEEETTQISETNENIYNPIYKKERILNNSPDNINDPDQNNGEKKENNKVKTPKKQIVGFNSDPIIITKSKDPTELNKIFEETLKGKNGNSETDLEITDTKNDGAPVKIVLHGVLNLEYGTQGLADLPINSIMSEANIEWNKIVQKDLPKEDEEKDKEKDKENEKLEPINPVYPPMLASDKDPIKVKVPNHTTPVQNL